MFFCPTCQKKYAEDECPICTTNQENDEQIIKNANKRLANKTAQSLDAIRMLTSKSTKVANKIESNDIYDPKTKKGRGKKVSKKEVADNIEQQQSPSYGKQASALYNRDYMPVAESGETHSDPSVDSLLAKLHKFTKNYNANLATTSEDEQRYESKHTMDQNSGFEGSEHHYGHNNIDFSALESQDSSNASVNHEDTHAKNDEHPSLIRDLYGGDEHLISHNINDLKNDNKLFQEQEFQPENNLFHISENDKESNANDQLYITDQKKSESEEKLNHIHHFEKRKEYAHTLSRPSSAAQKILKLIGVVAIFVMNFVYFEIYSLEKNNIRIVDTAIENVCDSIGFAKSSKQSNNHKIQLLNFYGEANKAGPIFGIIIRGIVVNNESKPTYGPDLWVNVQNSAGKKTVFKIPKPRAQIENNGGFYKVHLPIFLSEEFSRDVEKITITTN